MAIFGFGKKADETAANTEDKKKEIELEEDEKIVMDAEALFNFARMYEDQGDMDKAVEFFVQAAEKNYDKAQFNLGMIYEKGDGVPQDKEAAIVWYKKAAEQGYMAAQFNLGYMLYYGEGCEADQEEGLNWIQKAADQGDDAAKEFISANKKVEKITEIKDNYEKKKRDFIRRLLSFNEIYMIYSTFTNSPQIGYDVKTKSHQAFVFTELDQATRVCELIRKDNRGCAPVKIEKKDLVRRLGDLYLYGCNTVVVQIGAEALPIVLFEMIKRKDFSKLPEEKRPIENPELQRSMIYYMQEFRRPTDEDRAQKAEKYKALDRRMVSLMSTAKYLILFKEVGEQVDGKQQMQLIMVRNKKSNVPSIPIFTDFNELQKFAGPNQYKVLATSFEKLYNLQMPKDCTGFVINPAGCNVPVPQEFIKKLIDNQRAAEAAKKTSQGIIAANATAIPEDEADV